MDNQEVKKAYNSQNIDGNEFLQSQEWFKFQEAFGRRTFSVEDENFSAKIIEHVLPIVGRYFYVPRGPIVKNSKFQISNSKQIPNRELQMTNEVQKLIGLAREEHVGWIRIEPNDLSLLDLISASLRVVKAPYDVQPKEIFKIDATKSEEQLLAEMKSKTRYNINLARKKGVQVICTSGCHSEFISESGVGIEMLKQVQHDNVYFIEKFLELTKEMARRQGIVPHPEEYYRKMFETFPKDMLSLYVAEYNGKIIAANLMLFYGDTATYLHGASSNEHRNVMAPFLLQWQAILDAMERGCKWYDFGGISTNYEYGTNVRITNKKSSWSGITDFKRGFSPETEPVVFPGTYDIIVNPRQYALYKGLQKAKMILRKFRK